MYFEIQKLLAVVLSFACLLLFLYSRSSDNARHANEHEIDINVLVPTPTLSTPFPHSPCRRRIVWHSVYT